ncbi:GTP cyclohydrolase I FolE2 [ANME-2 cluster archaeon]|nr:MAG: GTP cyclohydrolase I FolE2 [ANME-2 cluster archaeon]RLG25169.1 MAG: GTP cyclohydrolase I FolE2 [Methanosarcinales archaeon]
MKPPVTELPDIQASCPAIPINLTRVGVTDVKKMIEIARKGRRPIVLIARFNIFVDLPHDRKGANLSRNFETIDEVLEEAVEAPVYEIEELCSVVARRLLTKHEYASRAEVQMNSEYVVKRKTPVTRMRCQGVADIFAEAVAIRSDDDIQVRKLVGAEVLGMTACPCAQEIMWDRARKELLNIGVSDVMVSQFLSKVPMATHNQRGRGTISIEVYDGYDVSLEKLIEIIENSMSSKIFELLKRSDEASVVDTAHRNPKFVEDCVRAMAHLVVKNFSHLPDDSLISIKQINEESIHQHNACAERCATLGELRTELADAKISIDQSV